MKVLLNKIRIDGETQARIEINYDVVTGYAEKMREGVVFPPVVAYFDGANYWLADGFHRYHGHKANASKDIEVDVKEGTQRDAQLYSFGANDDHGLQRTVHDKRRAVLRMLDDFEWSDLSDREIARICKVSHPFVAKVREGLKEVAMPKKVEDKPKAEKKAEKPVKEEPVAEEEFEEDDELHNMAVEHQALAEENQKLMNKLAVKNMEATEEEKQEALLSMEEKDARIKALEAEVAALKASRDTYQSKNADMLRQIKYLKKQLEKYEKVDA
jgi:uncharacterized small protein (DUF1192 family)